MPERGDIKVNLVCQLFDDLVAPPTSEGVTVRPSALAILRLMTSSNLADCSTGRSAGFSPDLKVIKKNWR